MKYRPTKRVLWLLGPLLPMVVIFTASIASDRAEAEARLNRGAKPPPEQKFSVAEPATWSTTMARPRDWLEQGMDAFGQWDFNPWKEKRENLFGVPTYYELRKSTNPVDQASYAELLRKAKEWQARLLARYPELAVKYRPVPPERNALLRWAELDRKYKDSSWLPPDELGKAFSSGDDSGWDTPETRKWLAANRAMLDEFRALGLMPERSAEGLGPMEESFGLLALHATKGLLLDARLALAEGDIARALDNVRAARGLSDHLLLSDAPMGVQMPIGSSMRNFTQRYTLEGLLPAVRMTGWTWRPGTTRWRRASRRRRTR